MKPWKNLKEIRPTINDPIISPKAKTERTDASAIFLFLRSEGLIQKNFHLHLNSSVYDQSATIAAVKTVCDS